ncbi:hypothetical protein AVEN_47741-1 [Araneus ventricosus]|uniref:Uncharacterized protein n=1 Tax=Araneus ventricosus TaxID=182803 RepID=A0A4Y2CIA5_ARAVE|nr:hypothetical protein AVEN_47741-1 [Araneus ventricosus]
MKIRKVFSIHLYKIFCDRSTDLQTQKETLEEAVINSLAKKVLPYLKVNCRMKYGGLKLAVTGHATTVVGRTTGPVAVPEKGREAVGQWSKGPMGRDRDEGLPFITHGEEERSRARTDPFHQVSGKQTSSNTTAQI